MAPWERSLINSPAVGISVITSGTEVQLCQFYFLKMIHVWKKLKLKIIYRFKVQQTTWTDAGVCSVHACYPYSKDDGIWSQRPGYIPTSRPICRPLSRASEPIHIYTYIHTYIHTYIYIHIYIHIHTVNTYRMYGLYSHQAQWNTLWLWHCCMHRRTCNV